MPRAPRKCANRECEVRVRNKSYCDEHKPKAWQGSTRSGATRSQREQDLRAQVLREEPVCACGAPSTVAGHIVPHAYGGPYVRSNLKGQCEPCNLAQIHSDRVLYRR
jgi:5-methylcytosine-specific restriction endonuclease McrA